MPQGAGLLLMAVVFFGATYFLTIRPQKKRMEEQKNTLNTLKIGDQIVTVGGVRGTITRLSDDSFEIETGSQGARLEFLKQAFSYKVTPVEGHQDFNGPVAHPEDGTGVEFDSPEEAQDEEDRL